jgi:hypothetical protein
MAKKDKKQKNAPAPAPAVTAPPQRAHQPVQQMPMQPLQQRYPVGMPPQRPVQNPQAMQRPPQNKPPAPPAPQLNEKQIKKLKKIKKREKDYFYVMRKFPCFLVFLFCLVVFAVSGGGLITSFMEMPSMVNEVLAITLVPDPTPWDERDFDDDGNFYESMAVPFTAGSYLFLSLNSMFGGGEEDEDGAFVPALSFLDAADVLAYEEFLLRVELISEHLEDGFSVTAFKFAPILLLLATVASLVAMVTSFLALLGKRIFKGFFWVGIIVLVAAVGMLSVGIIEVTAENFRMLNPDFEFVREDDNSEGFASASAILLSNDGDDDDEVLFTSLLDFNNLMPYLMNGAFAMAPETQADLENFEDIDYRRGAGIGFYALLGGGVLITVAGLFAKKRVPYSIFDR